jgi:hypothetical protein
VSHLIRYARNYPASEGIVITYEVLPDFETPESDAVNRHNSDKF